jgi:type I restriction enzyme, S subunit
MTVVRVDDLMLSDESGFACSKTKLVEEGLPHLRPFNITNDGRLELSQVYQVPAVEAPPSKRELLPGDVLFNNTNSVELVGKATIVREPMIAGFSNHLTRIRVDAKRIEPEYFALWRRRLRSTGIFTSQATQWVSQAAFRTVELRRLEIDLPGLEEQRRIVDLLARAGGIVRLRREAQQKADELIPAIFIDMFGEPATNPKNWPIQRLGELVQSVSGGTPAKARPEFWNGDLPWVSPKDMKRDEIVDAEDHVNRRVLTETGLKLVPPDSVLIVVRGMILVHTVPVAITQVPVTINQDMKALRPASCITSAYLQWLLKVNHAKLLTAVSTAAHGTKKLDTDALMGMPVPVPSIGLQHVFLERCESVRGISRRQTSAARVASAAFDALLARAFGRAREHA